jgi:hypothetical protein
MKERTAMTQISKQDLDDLRTVQGDLTALALGLWQGTEGVVSMATLMAQVLIGLGVEPKTEAELLAAYGEGE